MKILNLSRALQFVLVVFGAVVVSTLGIAASDEIRGISSRYTALLVTSDTPCMDGAVLVSYGTHAVCMDVYEAAASEACLYQDPKSEIETKVNTANANCTPVSQEARWPWRFVSYTEASQLCARVGKRLPTNEEWYKVALGLADTSECVQVDSQPKPGNATRCVSPLGVVNLVGNVWEWVSDTVAAGRYKDRALPASGYVTLVDAEGIVVETAEKPADSFGGDYATVGNLPVSGILRGGFYGSDSDGGVFSQNVAAPLTLRAVGVGFRCVQDVW